MIRSVISGVISGSGRIIHVSLRQVDLLSGVMETLPALDDTCNANKSTIQTIVFMIVGFEAILNTCFRKATTA